jgi:hypothetical protein
LKSHSSSAIVRALASRGLDSKPIDGGRRRNSLKGLGVQSPGRSVLGKETDLAEETKKRRKKVERQKLALRATLWPNLDTKRLWDRQLSDGWLSVPRSMPLLLQMMDHLSKGKPVSSTYLDLWCRTYDDSFVIANKSREMAFFSGFAGERAERTWLSRMRILEELGFISIAAGPNGPVSYVLIFNPYLVIKHLAATGRLSDAALNALKQRMIEIGAHDMDEPEAEPEPERVTQPKKLALQDLLKKRVSVNPPKKVIVKKATVKKAGSA